MNFELFFFCLLVIRISGGLFRQLWMKPYCTNTYNFWSSISAISNQAQSLRLVARLILTRNSTCRVLTCCLASSSPSSFTIWWTLSPSDLILSTRCNACCSSLVKKWNERVLKNTDKTRTTLETICLLQESWYEHQDNSNSSRGHFIPRSRHSETGPEKFNSDDETLPTSVLCFD